jgi:hypothetical protein
MKTRWLVIGSAAALLTACVPVIYDGPPGGAAYGYQGVPYYYSPSYCAGCWYGQWGGRVGYHSGGGRPWEQSHAEPAHHGENRGHDVRHEGHY